MPRFLRSLVVFRMSLGGFYQRVLVAAGAVAFLVVNWFCRPVRRRSPHEPQAVETALETEALLEAKEEASLDTNIQRVEDESTDASRYEAPKLSVTDALGQLRDSAQVAPEEISMQPVEGRSCVTRYPCERPSSKKSGRQPLPSDQPNSSAIGSSAGEAKPPVDGESSIANPVDEAYLKSLLDHELGPPKFPVRKQAPGPREELAQGAGEERSLQALLDQAFGPPRFVVEKTARTASVATADADGMNSSPLPKAPTALAGTGSWGPGKRSASVATAPKAATIGARSAGRGAAGVKRSPEDFDANAAAAAVAASAPQDVTVLTLSVTQGPALGKRAVADDPAGQYLIGRLPESWLQILDQEVSGRHAAVRWDGAAGLWMLHDVGSLNGTALAGEPIGREYKVPGEERALTHGDVVQLGTSTSLRAELSVARSAPVRAAAAAPSGAPAPAKRHHSISFGSGEEAAGGGGGVVDRSHQETVVGLPGLPAPGALVECPELGARLYVHNRLGTDHKRMGQSCEDVPHWELPFAPYDGAGIICVFDGHHGSQAAHQAKEHLPAVLRAKLLRRDGRQPPPLPPPPPPPPPRRADDEEDLIEAYDGSSEESLGAVVEEEEEEEQVAEPSGGDSLAQGGAGARSAALDAAAPSTGDTGGGAAVPGGEQAAGRTHGGDAGSVVAAKAEVPPEELFPPPPAGPPLPPLLRGRDMDSQRVLLRDAFLETDRYMFMEEGCTATVVMVEADRGQSQEWDRGRLQGQEQQRGRQRGGWTLQSANVGDSSALLVNLSCGNWCRLSEDHRIASSSSERERLAAMGLTVRNRLYGLNISRMLGDRFLKEENLGFLAEPFVGAAAQVGPDDHAFLIVASDGLWDVLPEDRAASMLLKEATRSSVMSLPRPSGAVARSAATPSAGVAPPPAGTAAAAFSSAVAAAPPSASLGCQVVADLLLTRALKERSRDDITISVLELGPHLWGPQ